VLIPFGRRNGGFSLIELVVVMAIVAALATLGMASFNTWIQNSQIRAATESMQAGVQLARAEALKRNARIRFSLVTSIDSNCALSSSGTNWVVSTVADPSGSCDDASLVIRSGASQEGMKNVTFQLSAGTTLTFNGLGQLVPGTGQTPPLLINIKSSAIECGGDIHCLRLEVPLGGQVRMCDTSVEVGSTDPRACYEE